MLGGIRGIGGKGSKRRRQEAGLAIGDCGRIIIDKSSHFPGGFVPAGLRPDWQDRQDRQDKRQDWPSCFFLDWRRRPQQGDPIAAIILRQLT